MSETRSDAGAGIRSGAAEAAPTHLSGLWRGNEVEGDATVRLSRGALRFELADHTVLRVPLSALDGCHLRDRSATLYLSDGDVLEMRIMQDSTRSTIRAALDAASELPELTRSLRSIGTPDARNVLEQERWFAPLLSARRAVVGISDPLRQLALIDADTIGEALAQALESLAVGRVGGSGAEARALEALLEERAAPVPAAVARLALAATTLEGSASDSRLADWRRWVLALRRLFREVDEAWPGLRDTLERGIQPGH